MIKSTTFAAVNNQLIYKNKSLTNKVLSLIPQHFDLTLFISS